MELVDMPGPRHEQIPIAEFLAIPPFPGHRDSAGRANRAEHLFKLLPEHTIVDIVELPDGTRYRLTGNTRAEVWKCGRSDRVPEFVDANVFTGPETIEQVRELGTHFDSREAAWSVGDHAFRAIGIAFEDGWRPTTTIGKSPVLAGAVRQADVYTAGYYSQQHGRSNVQKTELIMPNWREEIKLLDALIDTPTEFIGRDTTPFRVAHMAAYLLLLRYCDKEKVMAFIRAALKNEGTKDNKGMDGIFLLTEIFAYRSGHGRAARRTTLEIVEKILAAWKLHESQARVSSKNARVDPVDFCKLQGKAALKGVRLQMENDAPEPETQQPLLVEAAE